MQKPRDASQSEELNLLPILNLICLLIPFLLITAQFVKIGVILVETPRTTRGPTNPTAQREALDLTLVMTRQGYFLSSSHGVECPAETIAEDRLCFRRKGGALDDELLRSLKHHLWSLFARKYKGEEHYAMPADRHSITLIPEPDLPYEDIVRTLDAIRDIPSDAKDPPPPLHVPAGGCALEHDPKTGEWTHGSKRGINVLDSACMYHRVTLALGAT